MKSCLGKAAVVVAWLLMATLLNGCASTRQFTALDGATTGAHKFRVYVARHPTMLGAALTLEVRCNDRLMGALGYNGYLTWTCDADRKNIITWCGRRLQLLHETEEQVFIDIQPGDFTHRRLSVQDGQALIATMSKPEVIGRGYTLIEDASVGAHKGFVEFYEPNEDMLFNAFRVQRQGANQRDLKTTEINKYVPSGPLNGGMLTVHQRLRLAAPPGTQQFIMTCGDWTKTIEVIVKEGYVTPVNVDIIPDATKRSSDWITQTFKVDVVCEPPVEAEAHTRQLTCQ